MDDALRRGQVALTDGDWGAARACFEQALRERASAEALDGLTQALFSLGDYTDAIIHGEQAFAAYREQGEDIRAAACARLVGYLYGAVHGNSARAGGWMGRAVHLIAAAGDCPERARIELTQAVVAANPAVRERHLSAAAQIAQRCGATDIAFDAMSQRGLQLVAAGAVDAGMALLDESSAAVAGGEVRDLISVGAMYCKMLHACELTSDVRRAEEWLARSDDFVARTNRLPISAICRTHYGGVLTAAGRWVDAERELVTAVQLYDRSYRALRGAALSRLAALRVRQGRLAEAAELLVGVEHDAYADASIVELHLARGEANWRRPGPSVTCGSTEAHSSRRRCCSCWCAPRRPRRHRRGTACRRTAASARHRTITPSDRSARRPRRGTGRRGRAALDRHASPGIGAGRIRPPRAAAGRSQGPPRPRARTHHPTARHGPGRGARRAREVSGTRRHPRRRRRDQPAPPPRGAGTPGRAATAHSPRGRNKCSTCSAKVCPTPTSPLGSTSADEPRNTTSQTSWPSSASPAAPRPPLTTRAPCQSDSPRTGLWAIN